MVASEDVSGMRVGFAEPYEGYACVGRSFSIDGKRFGRGSKEGVSLISRDAYFLIAPWPRGKWWNWRAINKLTVITSYHPTFFSDNLPPQICANKDLPRDVTRQGYWPFRPEEVSFFIIPRQSIQEGVYDWSGQLTLVTNERVARIWTRPFCRKRLSTVLETFGWPHLR